MDSNLNLFDAIAVVREETQKRRLRKKEERIKKKDRDRNCNCPRPLSSSVLTSPDGARNRCLCKG